MTKEHFQKKVLSLQNKLFRYALSIVKERELARDIVQEVLMKLWNQRVQLAEVKNLEAWCVRMTRNKAYDKLKLHANKVVSLKLANKETTRDTVPDELAEQQDLIETVHSLLQHLPEKQREIFRLRDLMGYSNKEIEEMLKLDASQVKVNLFRARKKIRIQLHQRIDYGMENEKTAS
ncbi:MAG: RNA polymerase sigma factor [Saprospiraceae bacterium]